MALEIGHNKAFNQKGDSERDGQPEKWITLEQDQQGAVDDAGNDIHYKGDLDANAGWVPAEKGEGNTLDETEEEVNDEQGEEAEDDQYVGGGGTGDGEEGGGHGGVSSDQE